MPRPFYFGDDDSSASDDDLSTLPYPKPLTRASFLTPDFDPTAFLSSLNNRHQTLEDLRTELRQRSQELNKELLDLVNYKYEDFLSLGNDLRGGDEKIDEVRLGLMGFQRELEGIKVQVKAKREEVGRVIQEQNQVRRQIALGTDLMDVERSMRRLEKDLMVSSQQQQRFTRARSALQSRRPSYVLSSGEESDDSHDEDDESEDGKTRGAESWNGGHMSIGRLRANAEALRVVEAKIAKIGRNQAFLKTLDDRSSTVRHTIILDLQSALGRSLDAKAAGSGSMMRLLQIYESLGATRDAIKTIQQHKSGHRAR